MKKDYQHYMQAIDAHLKAEAARDPACLGNSDGKLGYVMSMLARAAVDFPEVAHYLDRRLIVAGPPQGPARRYVETTTPTDRDIDRDREDPARAFEKWNSPTH